MKVKLSNEQYEFLRQHLANERPDLFNFFADNNNYLFEVDDVTAYKVRDWAGEKLQKEGFDINYELNDAGVILEQLEDLFYE
jgi:hypothetical protein